MFQQFELELELECAHKWILLKKYIPRNQYFNLISSVLIYSKNDYH